jgi:hypothetical protein
MLEALEGRYEPALADVSVTVRLKEVVRSAYTVSSLDEFRDTLIQ